MLDADHRDHSYLQGNEQILLYRLWIARSFKRNEVSRAEMVRFETGDI